MIGRDDRALRASAYVRTQLPRFVEELGQFVRIASVSAQPLRRAEVARCAQWLAAHLEQIGMQGVQVMQTAGHPIVYAHWQGAPSAPTALLYGHYDVQPADVADGWSSQPFEPVLRGGRLCGRGSSDDKGQLFSHLKAYEAYLRTSGSLPINVTCLIEGEEEVGSPNFERFVRRHRAALAAQVAVLSDTPMRGPDAPALTYALRGALGFELEVTGARRELHSGNFGGAVADPVMALCGVLSRLVDADGCVAIPGFYARVRELRSKERSFMAKHGPTDREIMAHAGARTRSKHSNFSLYERTTVLPALSVTGITGGYTGPGSKASIPTSARANLDLRLVPDQTAGEVEQLLRRYLETIAPSDVRLSVRTRLRADPFIVPRGHAGLRVAAAAYRKAFGVVPAFIRRGGTIPAVEVMQRVLGVPALLMGFGLAEDRIHGSDECFGLRRLGRAIDTCIAFLDEARSLPNVPVAPRHVRKQLNSNSKRR